MKVRITTVLASIVGVLFILFVIAEGKGITVYEMLDGYWSGSSTVLNITFGVLGLVGGTLAILGFIKGIIDMKDE